MKVAITGATGLIGPYAAARLLSQGNTVRALVRDAEKLNTVPAPSVVSAVEAFHVVRNTCPHLTTDTGVYRPSFFAQR